MYEPKPIDTAGVSSAGNVYVTCPHCGNQWKSRARWVDKSKLPLIPKAEAKGDQRL